MKSIRFLLSGLLLMAFSGTCLAGAATDNVKATTDSILSILHNPKFQAEGKKAERRELMRKELDQRFDWNTSARSCLGRHWAKQSPAQQQEFVRLFSQFLENTYLDKFELYYDDLDRIDYAGEKILDNFASVKVTITTKTKVAHPVEYRMEMAGSDWKVYDVIIEGASLVKNYRDQFDEIIAKSSFDGLLADIKSKLQAH
jgi:phospholipid transport system substrate-binding protein